MKRFILLALVLFFNCATDPDGTEGMCSAAFAAWGIDADECYGNKCGTDTDGILIVNFLVIQENKMPTDYVGLTTQKDKDEKNVYIRHGHFGVVAHEIGHVLLGNFHSHNEADLMYPTADFEKFVPTVEEVLLARIVAGDRKYYCNIENL